MENTEPVAAESPAAEPIAGAGKTAGNAASSRTVTAPATTRKPLKQKANVYQAEYLGSGTFKISKPKRRSAKRRQSALKNRRRGSRR
jgi:hypothetical protein